MDSLPNSPVNNDTDDTDIEPINSVNYWNSRFSTDWISSNGPEQSRFFSRLAIEQLPPWLFREIRKQALTVADWGCAQGDGTDELTSHISPEFLTGIDFSSSAISIAAKNYPAITFSDEDWLNESVKAKQSFDIVFSSNTLEHFHNPNQILSLLTQHAKKAILLALPYREKNRIDEHFYSFLPSNIHLTLKNGFILLWSRVLNCTQVPNTQWAGEQIFLVYADPRWFRSLSLTLEDSHINLDDTNFVESKLITQHNNQLTALSQKNDLALKKLLTEKAKEKQIHSDVESNLRSLESQLCSLQGQLHSTENQLHQVESALNIEKDNSALNKHKAEKFYSLYFEILQSRSWAITKPVRFLARAIKNMNSIFSLIPQALNTFEKTLRKLPIPLTAKIKLKSVIVKAKAGISPNLVPKITEHQDPTFAVNKAPIEAENCALTKNLVSVVLPVYNQQDMLESAIESVLKQTYHNFELILLDDGSNKGIRDTLEKYSLNKKIRIYRQKNQKLPIALSNAFELATGEFWTWTSADNLMEPRQLEILVHFLKSNPATGMVYADYLVIDENNKPFTDPAWRAHNRENNESGEIRLPRSTESLNSEQDNFIGACFMYRGWIGRVLGEYDPIQGIEDYDYWMRINSLFSIEHLGLDNILYKYRVHSNTLSSRAKEEKILSKVQRLMHYEEERALSYSQPVTFYTDTKSNDWLVQILPSISKITKNLDTMTSGIKADNRCIIVAASSHSNSAIVNSIDKDPGTPVAILFIENSVTPYDATNLLKNPTSIAFVRDSKTAQRVRIVSKASVLDINSSTSWHALEAFTKNSVFYSKTHNKKQLKRTRPTPYQSENTNKKIVLQVDDFLQGGLENVIIDLAMVLNNNGFDCRILVLGKTGSALNQASEAGIVTDTLYAKENSYRNYLESHRTSLINAHYSTFGAEIAYNLSIPYIQTIHNAYVWLDPSLIKKFQDADKYTSLYTCVSTSVAKYTDLKLNLDTAKLKVFPNGINSLTFDNVEIRKERKRLRNEWGVSANETVYLNVASIMAAKAQLPLVKAFFHHLSDNPKCKLVLLGNIMEESYHREITSFLARHKIEGKVMFAGYNPNVGSFYYAADVFVLPSFWEGWSLSFGEALYSGIPIVSTNVGATQEFIERENILLVDAPFGDIINLDYTNISSIIHEKNGEFIKNLSNALSLASTQKRLKPSTKFKNSLKKSSAYQKYIDLFHELR